MVGKSLQACCFSKPKRNSTNIPAESENVNPHISKSISSSSSSSSSSAAVVVTNFNSLYEDLDTLTGSRSPDNEIGSDNTSDPELDVSIALASQRLIRPHRNGTSKSILYPAATDGPFASVRVGAEPMCSPDPQEEFRRSMREMAAALGLVDRRRHRHELQELLLCYLALNVKAAHRYIVGAFADLLRDIPPGGAGDD